MPHSEQKTTRSLRLRRSRSLRVATLLTSAALFSVGFEGISSAAPAMPAQSVSHAGWPSSLVFTFAWVPTSTALKQSFAPIAALIKKQLGVTVNTYFTSTDTTAIEAQIANKAQLQVLGPFEYELALHDHAKVEVLANFKQPPAAGGLYYWSLAIVNPHINPGITSVKDAKGQKICFTDPGSTSGYFYPEYALQKAGIQPSQVTIDYVGADALGAVDAAKGLCQVGFTNSAVLSTVFGPDHVSHSDAKIIWKSPPIPEGPMIVNDSVPASLRAALKKLLVTEANVKYLTAHGYCSSIAECERTMGGSFYGFAPASAINYSESILPVCRAIKLKTCGAP